MGESPHHVMRSIVCIFHDVIPVHLKKLKQIKQFKGLKKLKKSKVQKVQSMIPKWRNSPKTSIFSPVTHPDLVRRLLTKPHIILEVCIQRS